MKDVIRVAIEEALSSLGIAPAAFTVEHPAELSFGDYATNAALVCAKEAGRNPRELAEALRESLAGEIEYVERIEVAGPGFLNFTLARDFFVEETMRINELGPAWGNNALAEGKEVLVEYTSPNLFKPLHVGNLVGNIIGESIARLYERAGAAVHRINYPSDIGLTVAKGVWGLSRAGGDPHDINALGEAYRFGNEAYETTEEGKQEIEAVNRLLYAGTDESLNALRAAGLATSKAKLDALCAMLGTTFDTVIYESEASPRGAAIVREHVGDVFEESEGAVVYKGEKVGLHTRVFLNSQGLPTYEAKDLGNFAIKEEAYPHWDVSLIVTGNEQTEYFKVLYAALREVFKVPKEKTLGHIPTGFLTLTTGKMSSRKGNVLTGETVLSQLEEEARVKAQESRAEDVDGLTQMVAVAALKYQILKQSPGSNIVFDTARALSFEGDSGPYLQYTYARARSVAAKADAAGVGKGFAALPETPYDLERVLCRFEEALRESFEEYAPHVLLSYLTSLAGMFNTFYAQERIADPADVHAPYKRALVEAVAITLQNGLATLGMRAPEKM